MSQISSHDIEHRYKSLEVAWKKIVKMITFKDIYNFSVTAIPSLFYHSIFPTTKFSIGVLFHSFCDLHTTYRSYLSTLPKVPFLFWSLNLPILILVEKLFAKVEFWNVFLRLLLNNSSSISCIYVENNTAAATVIFGLTW